MDLLDIIREEACTQTAAANAVAYRRWRIILPTREFSALITPAATLAELREHYPTLVAAIPIDSRADELRRNTEIAVAAAIHQARADGPMDAATDLLHRWRSDIEAAQRLRAYRLCGRMYPRIAYGSEYDDDGDELGPCRDCAVTAGQLHVPNCGVEVCPRCRAQAISCDCFDDV
jgi:hypothetical protein